MNRLIYAASDRNPDLLYETGFAAPDPFLWFEVDGHAAIVVSPLEAGRARKQARKHLEILDSHDAAERFGIPERCTAEHLIAALSAAHGVTAWTVPHDFPYGLAHALAPGGLTFDPVQPFSPGRAVKTASEIKAVRRAIAITEDGIRHAFQILRNAEISPEDATLRWNGVPLTAEILRAEITAEIARKGATADGTIAAPGRQGADPHSVGFGPIRAGEPIVLDVFPRHGDTGCFGDLTRTVVKGHAPDIVRKTFETVRDAQELAFTCIAPGVPGCDPHNRVAEFFEQRGYITRTTAPACGFFHGLGHGIGLEIHEKPTLNPRNTAPLLPGNIVTVEPGLYDPDWGGIRIEDDVLVTETGCEKLSSLPVFLEIP